MFTVMLNDLKRIFKELGAWANCPDPGVQKPLREASPEWGLEGCARVG